MLQNESFSSECGLGHFMKSCPTWPFRNYLCCVSLLYFLWWVSQILYHFFYTRANAECFKVCSSPSEVWFCWDFLKSYYWAYVTCFSLHILEVCRLYSANEADYFLKMKLLDYFIYIGFCMIYRNRNRTVSHAFMFIVKSMPISQMKKLKNREIK
jgi:hypothetical protein